MSEKRNIKENEEINEEINENQEIEENEENEENKFKEKDIEKGNLSFIPKEKEELSFDSINFNINPFTNLNSEIQQNIFVPKDVNDELVLKDKETKFYQFNSNPVEIKDNTLINKEQLSSIPGEDLEHNRINLNNIYMKNNMNQNNSNNIINYNINENFGFIKSLNKNIYDNNKDESRYIDNNSTINNYNENNFNNNEENLNFLSPISNKNFNLLASNENNKQINYINNNFNERQDNFPNNYIINTNSFNSPINYNCNNQFNNINNNNNQSNYIYPIIEKDSWICRFCSNLNHEGKI